MEFRVKWQQCPRVAHPSRVLFIEATDEAAAAAGARESIEREHGIDWFKIDSVMSAAVARAIGVSDNYADEITGEDAASGVANRLVRGSAWFECTPMPDDVWRFTVKIDREQALRDAIGESRAV